MNGRTPARRYTTFRTAPAPSWPYVKRRAVTVRRSGGSWHDEHGERYYPDGRSETTAARIEIENLKEIQK